MLSLSPMKLFIIVAVVVILLGPDKLPEVAHKIGASWQSLRRFQQRVESEVRGALPDLPSTNDLARMVRSPVSVLNQLADRVENAPSDKTDADADADAPAPHPNPIITPLVNPPTMPPPTTGLSSADPSLN
jgi:Sec-independent protein translocase protein TatA